MTAFPTTPAVGEVTTRRATPADAADVTAMVPEITAHEDQTAHGHVDVEQWRRLLSRADVVVLLAERDGAPVGYVSAVRQLHLWTGGDVVDLDDLYVRPGHRDAGVGGQLMAALAAPESLGLPVGHGGRQRRRTAVLPPPRRHPAAQDPRCLAAPCLRRPGRRQLTGPRERARPVNLAISLV